MDYVFRDEANETNNEFLKHLCEYNSKYNHNVHLENKETVPQCIKDALTYCPHWFYVKNKNTAYTFRPVIEGLIHLSAPDMYVLQMQCLDLHPDLCISLLDIGCGSGWFTSMAAVILNRNNAWSKRKLALEGYCDPNSCFSLLPNELIYSIMSNLQSHIRAIDIHEDIVKYCESKVHKVLNYHGIDAFNISFAVQNVFEHDQFESYDRILCGADCPEEGLPHLKALLKIGGILVLPYQGHLCQIKRISEKEYELRQFIPCHFKQMVFIEPKPRPEKIDYSF